MIYSIIATNFNYKQFIKKIHAQRKYHKIDETINWCWNVWWCNDPSLLFRGSHCDHIENMLGMEKFPHNWFDSHSIHSFIHFYGNDTMNVKVKKHERNVKQFTHCLNFRSLALFAFIHQIIDVQTSINWCNWDFLYFTSHDH